MTVTSSRIWDALVVGAGPAGATAARRLSLAGASTLLLEKQSLPRYKACGGGVPARTLRLLNNLDIAPVSEGYVDTIDVSRFGRRQFRKASNRPLAWMVMRDRFDQFLTDLAAESGASVRDATPVQSIIEGDGCYEVETSTGAVRARHLLAADGATGPTARWLGIDSAPTRSAAYEVEVVAPRDALDHWHQAANVDIGYRPWGYGWVFPKDGKLSVGVVTAPNRGRTIRKQTDRYLGRLGLADADVLNVQGHPIRYRRSIGEPVARGRALLLGDAAGLADEFTAEGIAYAVHSANLAADAVLNSNNPAAVYTESVNQRIQPELNAARTISRLYYWCVTTWPWLALTASRHINYLWRAFFRVMRGDSTYTDELSILPFDERLTQALSGDA
ncbi:MAG: geranylgeranyl reductase family protein [Chloroflexota bacterium]|nr:geranylgeranyl reductase family protein [Chloroflexota bacterium]MDE2895633.1 geranylgeranyl reductase family protein [Chloroflexota bacterium]